MDELTMEEVRANIVGRWQLKGNMCKLMNERTASEEKETGTGENWDESDDIYEGEDGTNKFIWYMEKVGIYVIFRLETSEGVYVPEPDCPYIVEQCDENTLVWVVNNGKGKRYEFQRVNTNR